MTRNQEIALLSWLRHNGPSIVGTPPRLLRLGLAGLAGCEYDDVRRWDFIHRLLPHQVALDEWSIDLEAIGARLKELEAKEVFFNSGMSTLDTALDALERVFLASLYHGPMPFDVFLAQSRIRLRMVRGMDEGVRAIVMERLAQGCPGDRRTQYHAITQRDGHIDALVTQQLRRFPPLYEEDAFDVVVAEFERLGIDPFWEGS